MKQYVACDACDAWSVEFVLWCSNNNSFFLPYLSIFSYRPNIELEFNPKRFLQAVIILEEFCKELAAILQARVVSGLGAEKRTPLSRNVQ